MHAHAFPDDLAPRALAKLKDLCPWKPVGDGTVEGLLRSMDAANVDISVVCTIATKRDQASGILKWCEQIRSDRIEPFPSIHPDTPKPAKWIRKIAKSKFAGIKLHPMYQDFALDEQRLDPIYEHACEHGLTVTLHCGQDIAFPPTDDRASPQRLRRVIDKYPELRLIHAAISTGWWMCQRRPASSGIARIRSDSACRVHG